MDRNNNILIFFSCLSMFMFFTSCTASDKEYVLDLPDYNPKFEEIIGKYYFVPIKDELSNRDDYKYLGLKRGDSLFLEIKKDSSYHFNKFYYNQGKNFNELHGKIDVTKNSISISPQTVVKDAKIYIKGFKKSLKTGMYYYYGINSPTDATEFEYYILYKKM